MVNRWHWARHLTRPLNQILLGGGEGGRPVFGQLAWKSLKRHFKHWAHILNNYWMQLSCIFVVCVYVDLDSFFCQSVFDFPFSLSFFGFCAHFFAFPSNGIVAGYPSSKGEFCLEWVVSKGKQRDWPWIFFPKMLVVFSCDYGRIGQNFQCLCKTHLCWIRCYPT